MLEIILVVRHTPVTSGEPLKALEQEQDSLRWCFKNLNSSIGLRFGQRAEERRLSQGPHEELLGPVPWCNPCWGCGEAGLRGLSFGSVCQGES